MDDEQAELALMLNDLRSKAMKQLDEHLRYELERLYLRYHPDGDSAQFVADSAELVLMLRSIKPEPCKGDRSHAERQRKSLLNTLRKLEGTLVDHIDHRLWQLFGPPEQGKPAPLSQIILALDAAIPPDSERLIARKASDVPYHLAAVRLLWHCGFWDLPYPEGYLYLAEVTRTCADCVGSEATMKKHGDRYADKTLEAARSVRNAKKE